MLVGPYRGQTVPVRDHEAGSLLASGMAEQPAEVRPAVAAPEVEVQADTGPARKPRATRSPRKAPAKPEKPAASEAPAKRPTRSRRKAGDDT